MERNEKGGNHAASTQGTGLGEREDRVEELLASRQEFLQVFKRGAEFTEELLQENERLRYRVAELESRDFAERYKEIEQENDNLLNIYVASYQLHSTLDFDEVLSAITEVVLNFIGAEVFVVGTVDANSDVTRTMIAIGCEAEELAPMNPVVADVLESGMPHFVNELSDAPIDLNRPMICIPLCIKNHTIGFISIYKFLQHKKRLASVDHELFTLLAGHAATALFAARLYTDSKRKLNNVQGFIDLVTSSSTAG